MGVCLREVPLPHLCSSGHVLYRNSALGVCLHEVPLPQLRSRGHVYVKFRSVVCLVNITPPPVNTQYCSCVVVIAAVVFAGVTVCVKQINSRRYKNVLALSIFWAPDFAACTQQRCRPACASAQFNKRLRYSLPIYCRANQE